MEEKVDSVLASLGLSKNERKVYLDLIGHEKSSVLDIAKRAGIHRTNVYDALRTLEGRGFIAEKLEENKRLFVARSPEKIKEYISHLNTEVNDILPYLAHVKDYSDESEEVIMSKGTFALRDALMSLLEIGKPINIYGASRDALNAFGIGFLAEFHKKRIAKKIHMNHIYHQDVPERISQLNRMKYTYARYLPRKYDSAVSTAVCGNTVLLMIFIEPPSLIRIRNKKIAEAYDNYFEILWKNAK